MVYDILNENQLCNYYTLPDARGNSPDKTFFEGKYAYLDLPGLRDRIVEYSEGGQSRVNWYIPQMHCSSCIWLLENLARLHPGIVTSSVNFPEKRVRVLINDEGISFSRLADLLSSVGYEPYLSLQDIEGKKLKKINRQQLYKIGIAGFAFGNIMLMSFPEYFSLGSLGVEKGLQSMFGTLNLLLSLPVFFFSASGFFTSALKAIRRRQLNIDAPIALAILLTFVRSVAEIVTQTGTGYLDSMTGIVFFMLLGRYFQDKTHAAIAFDRDYKSYFPVAVSVLDRGEEIKKPVTDLNPGDFILIHNQELIPCDATLVSGSAMIDYSFVSGESVPVQKSGNDKIYAGGRAVGAAIELEVTRKVSQSYLTQLWNNDAFTQKDQEKEDAFTGLINRYFTWTVCLIGLVSFLFWVASQDFKRGFDAMTTVWIVACPCALLLSENFTKGNILGIFGRYKFYLKNAAVLEKLAGISAIVFDKTGTLTLPNSAAVRFAGSSLSKENRALAWAVTNQSAHPLSRLIRAYLHNTRENDDRVGIQVRDFREEPGRGMEAFVGAHRVRLGSAAWAGARSSAGTDASQVYLSVNNQVRGYFEVKSTYRDALDTAVGKLKSDGYQVFLLSGDKPTDEQLLGGIFGKNLHFSQSPEDKLRFISDLQEKGHKVMMIGDGLNDAGALIKSDAGVAISDDVNNFSPACDGILEGSRLTRIGAFIRLAKASRHIVTASFVLSVVYNIIGLYFAVQGMLSPVIAAILMPSSSISIILLTTISSNWRARQLIGGTGKKSGD